MSLAVYSNIAVQMSRIHALCVRVCVHMYMCPSTSELSVYANVWCFVFRFKCVRIHSFVFVTLSPVFQSRLRARRAWTADGLYQLVMLHVFTPLYV